MSKLLFTQNESPTIGVEVELQIIDAKTLALSNSIEQVLAALPERLKEQVKPELMQCYLEINTGLQSNRSKVMQDLPTAGLPHQMRNYSEYTWIVNHLIATGFINTIRELWWDIRPHHNFGTVEVRICDVPANLRQVLALTALVQCLVQAISEEVDEGTYQREYHPMMVEQNKWRATRFGADAHLVSSIDYRPYSVEETLEELIEKLRPMARRLGCLAELESAAELPKTTGAKQQLAVFAETGNLEDVVRRMLEGNTWR